MNVKSERRQRIKKAWAERHDAWRAWVAKHGWIWFEHWLHPQMRDAAERSANARRR